MQAPHSNTGDQENQRFSTILPAIKIKTGAEGGDNQVLSRSRNASFTDEIIGPIGNMQAVGDSILGFNKEEMRSIPDVVGQELGVSMINNAVGGAEFRGSEGIGTLYQRGSFSHVLVNGGGNDFARQCSQTVVDDIISADLRSGLMVDLVDRISNDGAQSVIMGYYMPRDGEIGCPLITELMARYSRLAEKRQDVLYINTIGTITPTTPSLYFAPNDPVHPSPAGSEVIGRLIADRFRSGNGDAGIDLTILGNAEDNTLQGGSGNDTLRGNNGKDTMRGDTGNDKLFGGQGNDKLLGSGGDDQLVGGSGDDTLRGGAGNDTLRGGAGADRLMAGPGNDMLIGQRGSDQYVLSKNGFAEIRTFDVNEDTFRIRGIRRFDQLQVVQDGRNTMVLQGNDTLAVFINVDAGFSADVYG